MSTVSPMTPKVKDLITFWPEVRTPYSDAIPSPETGICIGDVARSAGAEIALKCTQALDWSDTTVRRTVIGILLRWLRRGNPLIDDDGVLSDIDALQSWAEGDTICDLSSRAEALLAELGPLPPHKQRTSDEVVRVQLWLLMEVSLQRWRPLSKWVNWGAACAVTVGSQLILAAGNDAVEQGRQVADFVEVFPGV